MQGYFESLGLMELSEMTVLVRMALAAIFGCILGWERMKKLRAAGIRTYMLVCMGACIAMMTGLFVNGLTDDGDPTRIASQVVSGIGFIGAGTIIISGFSRIRGLTTAAGIWATACVGLAVGAGFYLAAIIMNAMLMVAIRVGTLVQKSAISNGGRLRMYAVIESEEALKAFFKMTREGGLRLMEFDSQHIMGCFTGINFTLELPKGVRHIDAIKKMESFDFATFIAEV